MEPTLTLQISFVLLGRKEVLDPSKHMPKEERRIRPLVDIHKALKESCPQIDVRLIPSSDQATQNAAWHLFPSPLSSAEDVLDIDERAKLRKNIWACPAVLQRPGIPINTSETAWHTFTLEAAQIFKVLGEMNAQHGPIDSLQGEHGEDLQLRYWSLITPADAYLRISLVPSFQARRLHRNLVKRTLVIFAALERELTLLATPSSLLRYWSLSRFLEYRAIRRLGQEKAEMWTKLRDKKDWTEKRKGLAYAKEKRTWFGRFDEEDRASERTKGRRREWWDVVDGVEIADLLADIARFKSSGRHMAIEPEFARDEDEDEDDTNTDVTGISFQSHHSTMDVGQLIAYTELIAALTHLAHDFDQTQLEPWLLSFRETANEFPSQPLYGFEKLLSSLHISAPSISSWKTYFRTESHGPALASPVLLTDPFHPLTTHITHTLSTALAYIPTFIARYSAADGFHPTPTSKIYALMMADEHEQRKANDTKTRTTKGNEDWLGGVKDKIRVADAKHRHEDMNARAPRSPGSMQEEEKIELGMRVRKALCTAE